MLVEPLGSTEPRLKIAAVGIEVVSKPAAKTACVCGSTSTNRHSSHPEVRLTSRRPVWLEEPQPEEVSPQQKWTEKWAASNVVNRSLIVDPFIAPPGFDLLQRLWSTLNHFRTGQSQCAANLVRWNQASDPSCSCGAPSQTMSHTVNDCPDTKFPGGLSALHLADEKAIAWLGMQSIC